MDQQFDYKPCCLPMTFNIETLLDDENIQQEDNYIIQSLKEFNISDFCKLDDNLLQIYQYIADSKTAMLCEEETFTIFDKIFSTKEKEDNILEVILLLISKFTFIEKTQCNQIFSIYLNGIGVSEKLLRIITRLMIISESTIIDESFLHFIVNETDLIYNNFFWKLCIFFRKYENIYYSNCLWEIGIFNIIDKIIKEYDALQIPISTIELIFKLFLSIITNDNLDFILANGKLIVEAAHHFQDDFIEAFLVILLIDEDKASIEDI